MIATPELLRPIPRPAVPVSAPVSLQSVRRLLRGLDREQRRAVTHRDGPLLVVAGPGTGKTQVITRRIAWLIATKRARPEEILALTFTDKAAREMQGRVDELVPYGQADAAIHTFHALGDALIREHALELGLVSDLRLLTRAESVIFLRERLFQLGLDRYRPLADPTRFLGALVSLMSRAKDEDVSPEAYLRYAADLATGAEAAGGSGQDALAAAREEAASQLEIAHAYERASELMVQAGCIDFGDQVAVALRLLRE
ncbi:MAG: UvrD-helicase domain-containing protein, partial [Chloroflexi bacterium]|nr:UvrD-helicase domain-containing protein [Chloroflexota bacterium]